MSTFYCFVESPIGPLLVTSDGASVTGVYMDAHKGGAAVGADWIECADRQPLAEARRQLDAYFAGALTRFDLPLAPCGTPFQRRVWRELQTIGFGETVSYGEIARRIELPSASCAVGLANGRNPVSVIIPCHRVIGANGKLTGYGGGLPRKAALLDFERAVLAGGPQTVRPIQPDLFATPE
ncbi:MAG TPA: methylated-DNA--[protein]-cysteine S-methyltransferase [Chthonomonadaceae bacterium]|nr:methylated-DNA--[protein]-cysteine S-methyltransferase [Chthonomonadaceae bacterium]